jgi:hypothetical protein
VIFRRPYADLVERQLALFAADNADLLEELVEAERAYDRADRDSAAEAYGDFQLVVEAAGEALADLRDHFAATLDEEAAESYRAAFNRAAARRWRRLAVEL